MTKYRSKWDAIFRQLGPINGKITGLTAKEMIKLRLSSPILAKIWRPSDADHDSMLDSDEFALATHLIYIKLEGIDLLEDLHDLPDHLIPPSMKHRLSLTNGRNGGNSGSGNRRRRSGLSEVAVGGAGGAEGQGSGEENDAVY